MPNIPLPISAASRPIPVMSMRDARRAAEAGTNRAVSAMSSRPIGTLIRKMPRQDQ